MSRWYPRVVILGPGGMKGFLELGALLYLTQHSVLDRVEKYIGVSVGAIIALLLVAGYNVEDIIADAVDTAIFPDIAGLNLSEIRTNCGLVSNGPIKDKLTRLIVAKFGKVLTLGELYAATGIHLVLVSLNLDRDRTEYISDKTEPSISCVDAVLLSMNIPGVFYKIKYQDCVYIDGAFGNPYPVDQDDDGSTDILGIYIQTMPPPTVRSVDESDVLYAYKIAFSSIIQFREMLIAKSSPRVKHLSLSTQIIDSVGIRLNINDKCKMITDGYELTKHFISEIENNIVIADGSAQIPFEPSDRDDSEIDPEGYATDISSDGNYDRYSPDSRIS